MAPGRLGLRLWSRCGQLKRERRPTRVLSARHARQLLAQTTADRKPKPAAAVLTRDRGARLFKGLKDVVEPRRRYRAGVSHADDIPERRSAARARARKVHLDLAASVNRTAFDSRLIRIWRNRASRR